MKAYVEQLSAELMQQYLIYLETFLVWTCGAMAVRLNSVSATACAPITGCVVSQSRLMRYRR